MAYLETLKDHPAGKYSPELLSIDEQSGPWLAETQRTSPVARGDYPRFDADLEEGVIWFGDDRTNGLVARMHAIGSYSPDDGAFVWAWTNEMLAALSARPKQVADDHADVSEFEVSLIEADELKAWTLAAAVAYLMKADACFRLPGELQLFVALTDLTVLEPDDPRARRLDRDPAGAAAALGEFAGQGALRIGAALVEQAQQESPSFDGVIEVLHRFCDRLEAMGSSPVGRDTPAAQRAAEIAAELRRAALSLSLPPGHPEAARAAQGVLAALEAIAREFGAWPESD
ncbi:MAG: hypothetical protein JRI23_19725 [Deltaproteobacteria bacterium]|nr:hypothetical protein [Deltaproteobacteria bacterium]MBW2534095.1 hypothetical protein [Deltaproteobacteria bacterium]